MTFIYDDNVCAYIYIYIHTPVCSRRTQLGAVVAAAVQRNFKQLFNLQVQHQHVAQQQVQRCARAYTNPVQSSGGFTPFVPLVAMVNTKA